MPIKEESTVGSDGAYLIVTRAAYRRVYDFHGVDRTSVDVPVDGPITAVHYVDGATCDLMGSDGLNRKPACAPALKLPVGWVPPKASVPTTAEVASPIHVRLVRAEAGSSGYEAVVQFTSRIAIANARSFYMIEWHEAAQRAAIHSFGPPSPRYPAAGETVKKRLFRGLPRGLLPGLLTGEVVYDDDAGTGAGVKRIVGRFALSVP